MRQGEPTGEHFAARRRWFLVLPLLQLAGCAFDVTHRQIGLGAIFCLAAQSAVLSWTGSVAWLALTLSLPIGFAAVWLHRLRRTYLAMLFAIPIA